MFFRQIYDEGLAQASYVIGCEAVNEAIIVDPRRDIDVYTSLASREGFRITAVAETHIHADYLSGGRELAAATGALFHISDHGDADLGYLRVQEGAQTRRVRDGEMLSVGAVRLRVRHTPGHTPEHISFEIFDANNTRPMMLLSGDFMFVGDLGRPDLLEEALGVSGAARSSATTMFRTLQRTLADLPDFVQIWPAHGAGSACGKALSAVPSTTLGYERRFSWWSTYAANNDEGSFVASLLAGQPDAPTYFARMKDLNRGSAPLLRGLPKPQALDAARLVEAIARGATVIDTRSREAFAQRHIDRSISVPNKPSFSSRAAWFADPKRPIVLIAQPEASNELVRKLVRVGLDDVAGYLNDVEAAGQPLSTLPKTSLDDAHRRWSSGEATILDVRQRGEYAEAHIPGAINVSAGSLVAKLSSVPKDRPLLVMCAGGDRSVAAASVLQSVGVQNVANVSAGFNEWRAKGFPAEESQPVPGLVPS